MNLDLDIAEKVKLLKDKEDTMKLMEEAATDKLKGKVRVSGVYHRKIWLNYHLNVRYVTN